MFFFKKHCKPEEFENNKLPLKKGYSALWQNRGKLIALKEIEANRVNCSTFKPQFIYSGKDRHEDDFIELHIFAKKIDWKWIESIKLTSTITSDPKGAKSIACDVQAAIEISDELRIPCLVA